MPMLIWLLARRERERDVESIESTDGNEKLTIYLLVYPQYCAAVTLNVQYMSSIARSTHMLPHTHYLTLLRMQSRTLTHTHTHTIKLSDAYTHSLTISNRYTRTYEQGTAY